MELTGRGWPDYTGAPHPCRERVAAERDASFIASPNPKLAAYFDFRDSRCARALAAADFAFALEFGLRSTLDAALAAGLDVTFAGALVCDRALAAAFFAAVDLDAESVADAFVAALCPVVLFPMNALSCSDLAVDV